MKGLFFFLLIIVAAIIFWTNAKADQSCRLYKDSYYNGYCAGVCYTHGGCNDVDYSCECTGNGSNCGCTGSSQCEDNTNHLFDHTWQDDVFCGEHEI